MPYKDPSDPRAKAAKLRHYYANKEQYLERNRAKKAELREALRERKNVPCVDCGVRYPYYVMQFDHIGSDKEHEPATLVSCGSWEKFNSELAKCEVVCANCHAERTHQRLQQNTGD